MQGAEITFIESAGNIIRLTTMLTFFPSYYTNKLLQVKKRLEGKKISCAIPTLTTARYQFARLHAVYKTSFKYKSEFDVVIKSKDGKFVNIMKTLIMSVRIICKDKCFYLVYSVSQATLQKIVTLPLTSRNELVLKHSLESNF